MNYYIFYNLDTKKFIDTKEAKEMTKEKFLKRISNIFLINNNIMKNLKEILLEKLSIDSISLDKEESTDNIEDFKVGDILVSTFSYTMTIVEFFKIVKKSGKKTFYLQPIGQKVVSGDSMQGECVPKQPIEYAGEEIKIMGSRDGKLRGGKSHGYRPMYTYIGNPVYFDNLD